MDQDALDSIIKAGAVTREARQLGAGMIGEGVSLLSVAEEVEALIEKRGAKPAFPVNISINQIAAHYTPASNDASTFRRGDVVKLDVGAHVNGYMGDTAVTVEVGTRNWSSLIDAPSKALSMVIDMISEGVPISAIGGTIETGIKSNGFVPIRNLAGHEIKRHNLHSGLSISNYDDGNITKVHNDMLLAIEPFATDGAGEVGNSKPGNIYIFQRDREIKDAGANRLFDMIKDEFGSLAFCERWCTALDPKASAHLRTLVRYGAIHAYPILTEVKGGMVSQTEHTILINGSRAQVTT
ncbi:type II methionyl aminopeptidase [Methanomassiliicoccus luminyensis]|uniref:type II methionyl aminopeptidase n=1 Tax=Methanomassiliicoccus luminyensis TaxID=1080712 RepID=UPI000368352C|nr:type II methionyl aminopeptidase [Methanomassiliicoccus luminyensis]